MICDCNNWCRAEPQPITDKHHKECPHYDDVVRVVKITHEGQSYYERDFSSLTGLAEGDDYKYTIEFMNILERELDAMPEFTGF